MTPATQGCRPASGAARGALAAALAGALAIAGTVALAQPSWEPTVSAEAAAAKAPASAPAAVPAAKPKPAPVAAPALPPAAETIAAAKADPEPVAKTVNGGRARKGETGSVEANAAKDYCVNIANAAADARLALQKKALAEIDGEIAKRIALLAEKTAEYQKWLARRDEFSKKASDTVLRIYARMRPDAAAVQLAALDEETAAAVLMKLEARTASLILNDMEPARAVRLTATISGSGRVTPPPPATAKAEAKKQ